MDRNELREKVAQLLRNHSYGPPAHQADLMADALLPLFATVWRDAVILGHQAEYVGLLSNPFVAQNPTSHDVVITPLDQGRETT